jgi:hypothetical protein
MNRIVDKTSNNDWGIMRDGNGRFAIIDISAGTLIDNAQGHGYDSYDSAYNFGYNKFHTKGACNGEPNVDYLNTLL